MSTRLDIFNATAGLVLAKLYDVFPLQASFFYEGLIEESRAFLDNPDADKGVIWASIVWLADNNYIRQERPVTRHTHAGPIEVGNNYSLTDKGLAALQRIPSALEPSLGDQLKSYVTDSGKEAGKQALGGIVGEVFGGMIKSILS